MDIVYLEEIDSTNKYAKEHISEIPDKTVICAEKQTNGKGRLGRKWNFTGSENIYASIVLKPSNTMHKTYSNLTQYLCVVLAEVFEEYGVKPSIKWPNDIQISGKKISGILAEAVTGKDGLAGLVLGFGINLNADKEELFKINQPATALNIEIKKNTDKNVFLKKLIRKFFLRYDSFIEKGFLLIKEDYKKRASFLKTPVTVRVLDKEICGTATDITDDGALVINDNNKEHVLLIGDIL